MAPSTAVQDVPVLPATIPSSDRLADEALGVLDRVRPPGLIATSDLGGCLLVDYDPVLGLDGTGRGVIYCTTTFNGLAVARRVWLDWVSQAHRLTGHSGDDPVTRRRALSDPSSLVITLPRPPTAIHLIHSRV